MIADVAIVGAGIAGVALAARLAPHGRVLLLEREPQPGTHSTGRSAAMFMESYGSPQGRALTRASRAACEQPNDPPLLSPRGAWYAAWTGSEAAIDAMQASLALPRIDAATALAAVPVLRAQGLVGALVEADAMDIDVAALLQRWLVAARQGGVAVWTGAELASAQRRGGTWALTLADGRSARAGTLVDAAGAWADAVAQRAGVAPLGLQPRRRSAFTFDAPAGVAHRGWPVVGCVAADWYFKPDAGQLLGSPGNVDAAPAHDVQPEEIDIATGIAAIVAHTTLAIRRPRRCWAGLRTFAPDGEMVIGADRSAPGFFWLAAQGGWGIQSAAGCALLAEALITGGTWPDALRQAGVDADAVAPARLRAR